MRRAYLVARIRDRANRVLARTRRAGAVALNAPPVRSGQRAHGGSGSVPAPVMGSASVAEVATYPTRRREWIKLSRSRRRARRGRDRENATLAAPA
jgi:hypothetical protein